MATKSSRGAVGASASPKVATRHASACASRSGRVHVVRSSPHMGHAHPSRGRPPPAVARPRARRRRDRGRSHRRSCSTARPTPSVGTFPSAARWSRGASRTRARAPARPRGASTRPRFETRVSPGRVDAAGEPTWRSVHTIHSRLGAPARPARIRRRPVRPAQRASAPSRRSTRDMRIKLRHPRSKTWRARRLTRVLLQSRLGFTKRPSRTATHILRATHLDSPIPHEPRSIWWRCEPTATFADCKAAADKLWPNYLRTSPTPPTASSATTTSSFGIPDTGSDATA